MTKEVFLLNTTIHFVSDNGWEYEVRQKRVGDDTEFYLWTIDDDLICQVPKDKIMLDELHKFVLPKCKAYEKKVGRT
jgi:hypothetical protein